MPALPDLFGKYKNSVFIETGSYLGDGVQLALNAGFDKVISIELSDYHFNICVERFKGNSKVEIVKGESFKVLPEILAKINTKITFWLDGHYSEGGTALGEYAIPILQELEAISIHHIKEHTILIDDMRCMVRNPPHVNFDKEDVINKIYGVNPSYRITYENGTMFGQYLLPNDILVATMHSI